ncbi:MAG: hypothetical protein HQL07_07720 [Nitrospirae bacterium]|nr:hypothetical protein [Magnetococcales bacterium]
MSVNKKRRDRLVALTIFGVIAFNYPLLAIFDRRETVFGVPLVFCYLFGFWLLFVIVTALIAKKPLLDHP